MLSTSKSKDGTLNDIYAEYANIYWASSVYNNIKNYMQVLYHFRLIYSNYVLLLVIVFILFLNVS